MSSTDSSRARLAYPLSGTGAGTHVAGTARGDATAPGVTAAEDVVPARTPRFAAAHPLTRMLTDQAASAALSGDRWLDADRIAHFPR